MRTNLAYIDDVIDRETERRHVDAANSLTEGDRKDAKTYGTRVVAGFSVFDEERERAALDRLIERRRSAIQLFRDDRTRARDRLGAMGITPLAVVPLTAWHAICDQVGLFRLCPDKDGRVGVKRGAFDKYMIERQEAKAGMFGGTFVARSYSVDQVNAADIERHAKADWPAFLKTMFGGLVAPAAPDRQTVGHYLGHGIPVSPGVTLVLPTPPADVAAILLKASAKEYSAKEYSAKEYLGLHVAAVAEAISFRETPSEILKNEAAMREAEARRQEHIDRDPIIYHHEGTAAAIIAQFGDFPIEQQVVDAVVTSEKLIGDLPVEREVMQGDDYRQDAIRQMMMARSQMMAQQFLGTGDVFQQYQGPR